MKIVLIVLAAAVLLYAPPMAVADDTPCFLILGPGTFDNVVVFPGGCFLHNSVIRGNVKLLERAEIFAQSNTIHGNIEATANPGSVFLFSNVVEGNIHIVGGQDGGFNLCNNVVSGSIQVEKRRGAFAFGHPTFCPQGNRVLEGNITFTENVISGGFGLSIHNNTVGGPPTEVGTGGDLQVFKNIGVGPKSVTNNTVRQNVQCKENAAPFVSAGNMARQYEEQCPF